MMDRILEILSSIRADIDFEKEEKLIDDGILDSFDIVSIVAELCAEYDVTITVDMLEPENFNSAAAMLALVESILDED
ncbi:MAG: acyl carrier protein [Ruminococcus sp.]|nr:acyl carrier protein [Ruminococcus sp.]